MAARFPQSATPVSYKIATAYASKIKAVYWAASADSIHVLKAGDTATTILSRASSGAGFNADGRITGSNNSVYFQDNVSALSLLENSDQTYGFFGYGDLYNGGASTVHLIATGASPDTFNNINKLRANGYVLQMLLAGGAGGEINTGTNNDVAERIDVAVRLYASDPINTYRQWLNGSEQTAVRKNAVASQTDAITTLYLGGTHLGTGNTAIEWEGAFLGTGNLTDAELAAITADPTVLIEAASSSATITLTPDPASVQVGSARTFTATRSAPAGAGGVTYNVSSDNPAVATVPTPQALTEADSDLTFDATGVSVGTANITITNAADSSETDTVVLTVTAVTTKKAKFLVHPDFASATGITIEVNEAPSGGALTGAKLGFATGIAAEATLESGQAVIKVNAADVGASALAAGTSVRAIFKGTTSASSPLGNAVEGGSVATAAGTIIEE